MILVNNSNAFKADFFLMALRLPVKWNSLQLRLFLPATAMKTVPFGFKVVSPPGPAMPVIPMPKSTPAIFLILLAIRPATGEDTAPFFKIREAGIFRIFDLDRLL